MLLLLPLLQKDEIDQLPVSTAPGPQSGSTEEPNLELVETETGSAPDISCMPRFLCGPLRPPDSPPRYGASRVMNAFQARLLGTRPIKAFTRFL